MRSCGRTRLSLALSFALLLFARTPGLAAQSAPNAPPTSDTPTELSATSVPGATDAPRAISSLQDLGFNIDLQELVQFLELQRSLFLDPAVKVNADWSDTFDELRVLEIPETSNRYAYGFDSDLGVQVVAIRGTANLKNALLDLESWKIKSAILGINLHAGFERAADAVYEDLKPRLKREFPIVVVGHSLGAAEAIIVGMLLARDGFNLEKIVASGLPKVTDEAGWAKYSGLPLIRVVGAYDPVPFLPPRDLYRASPYTQSGKLLMLLDGPYVTVAEPGFFDSIPAAFKSAKSVDARFNVSDHRIWTYYDRASEKVQGMKFVPFERWNLYARSREESAEGTGSTEK